MIWPFRPQRTFRSVVDEIVEGVENGTVVLPGTGGLPSAHAADRSNDTVIREAGEPREPTHFSNHQSGERDPSDMDFTPRTDFIRWASAALVVVTVVMVVLILFLSLGSLGFLALVLAGFLCALIVQFFVSYVKPFAGACFPSSAPVLTPNGSRLLGDIAVGDRVLSWSELTRSWVIETVLSRLIAREAEVLRIRLAGEKEPLCCTPNHPIFTPTGIKAAEQLRPGDEVLCFSDYLNTSVRVVLDVSAAGICPMVVNLYVSGEANYVCYGVLVHSRSVARKLRTWVCKLCA